MTFPNKLKTIRTKLGLSQEQLAEKMRVSRQAVTKWESGDGMPDTLNMKELAKLSGLTIDYLLDNAAELPLLTMVEEIEEDEGGFFKADKVVRERYPDFTIYGVARRKRLNFIESVIDFFVGAGTLEVADQFGNMSRYFLVERGGVQLLVSVSKANIISRELNPPFDGRTLRLDGNVFHRDKTPIA